MAGRAGTRAASRARPCGRGGCRRWSGRSRASRAAAGRAASCSASLPSGSTSTALRVRSAIGANARLPPPLGGSMPSPSVSLSRWRALGIKRRRRGGEVPPVPPAPPDQAREAAAEEAARPLRAARPRRPRPGLDGLRDDGGGLPGPAGDLQLRPVQGLEEQRGLRRHRRTDRHPDQRPEQNPAQLRRRSPPTSRTRWSRSRTRASTNTTASTSRASAAPWSRTSSARAPQQGASTITEQFVKNALEAEGSRTVFEKFREAALAYRLERHWSKDKILTEYLNTIYFGEGAYGIEAAARTYFGAAHPGCGTTTEPCASVLEPWEAATLAGDHRLALGLRPQGLPRKRARPPQPGAGKDVRTGLHLPRAVRGRDQAGAALAQRHRTADARLEGPLLHRLPAPAAGRTLRRLEGLLRRPQGQVDARPAAAGSGRRSGQLLPRLLAGDRLGGRDRQPQRRHQGDGRRARLRNQALQPGDPGPPPARLLDQALHAADRARRGDLAGNGLRIGAAGTSTSASTARKSSTVHNDEDSYLGSCSIICATTYSDNSIYAQLGAGRPEGQDGPGPHPLDRRDDPQDGLRRPDLDQPGDGPRRPRRTASPRSAGPTPTRRSATTATASAARWRRGPATAPSPTPRSPTRTATRSRAATTTPPTSR